MGEMINQRVWVLDNGQARYQRETLPREQPFTIQVRAGRQRRNAAETTRTPGHDYEFAAGLLYAAGYIDSRDDFAHMTYCVEDAVRQEYNLLTVALRATRLPALPRPEEVIVDGSSCGVSSDNLLAALASRSLPALPAFSMST
jgi:FdhD protein